MNVRALLPSFFVLVVAGGGLTGCPQFLEGFETVPAATVGGAAGARFGGGAGEANAERAGHGGGSGAAAASAALSGAAGGGGAGGGAVGGTGGGAGEVMRIITGSTDPG